MAAKKVTSKNVAEVAVRLLAYALSDKEVLKSFCESFDRWLDELLGADFFGTEGQNDPRGDRRS